MQEIVRILKTEGQIAIAHFDWIPLKGNVAEATEQLIQTHNPTWKMGGGSGLYPQWLRDIAQGRVQR
jgi:hypothetical protein